MKKKRDASVWKRPVLVPTERDSIDHVAAPRGAGIVVSGDDSGIGVGETPAGGAA